MEDCVSGTYCKVCQEKYDEINFGQNKRLEALEMDVKQINSLAIAIEKMAVSIQHMTEELAKQGKRLDEIEAEPGKKWKQAIWIGVSVLVTAVITHFISHFGM